MPNTNAVIAALRAELGRTDRGHGSPYDRGGADYYYGRPFRPHCFEGASYATPERTDLTATEKAEYAAGWDRAEAAGDKKEWD
jgi:hypothetical protein